MSELSGVKHFLWFFSSQRLDKIGQNWFEICNNYVDQRVWTWYTTGIESQLFEIISSSIKILPYCKLKTVKFLKCSLHSEIVTKLILFVQFQFLNILSAFLLTYLTMYYYWLTWMPIAIQCSLALCSVIFLVSSTINWKTSGKICMARINFVSCVLFLVGVFMCCVCELIVKQNKFVISNSNI